MTTGKTDNEGALALASTIVTAYVGHHRVQQNELPEVLRSVHATLLKLGTEVPIADARTKATPAEIKRSITPDHLISFEDGKAYMTLRRHLGQRDLTPDQYRTKWGLPGDYPMTAPNYSTRRSEIARTNQFGHMHRVSGGSVSATKQNEPTPIDEQMAASVDRNDAKAGAGAVEFERHGEETDGSGAAKTREPFEEDGAVDEE